MSCSFAVFLCDLGNVENDISNGRSLRDDHGVAGVWPVSGCFYYGGIRSESPQFRIYGSVHTAESFPTTSRGGRFDGSIDAKFVGGNGGERTRSRFSTR